MPSNLAPSIDKLTKAMAELSGDLKSAIALSDVDLDEIPWDDQTSETSFVAEQVSESVIASSPEIYSGRPTGKDLGVINSLVGRNTEAEEWSVYCYRASDNFLHGDESAWHPRVLEQMAKRYVGANFMIDHDWGNSSAIMGFVMESSLHYDASPSSEIVDASVFGEMNRQILSENGTYSWLMLKVVVPAGSAFDLAASQRRTQFCSTGFLVYDHKLYCPDCSKANGRDIEFTEQQAIVTKEGKEYEFICGHIPPSPFMRSLWEMYGDPDEESPFSSYSVHDGNLKIVELSGCASPMLPAMGLLRGVVRD